MSCAREASRCFRKVTFGWVHLPTSLRTNAAQVGGVKAELVERLSSAMAESDDLAGEKSALSLSPDDDDGCAHPRPRRSSPGRSPAAAEQLQAAAAAAAAVAAAAFAWRAEVTGWIDSVA